MAAYEAWLLRLYGFHRPLETQLKSAWEWEALGFDWTERAKAEWLRDDLLSLGASPAKIDGSVQCRNLPAPATLAEACGCVYVLEDATLGGAQLLLELKRSPIPTGARKFVTSYGSDLGNKWREFCTILDRLEGNEIEAAIRGANATFAALSGWLDSGAPGEP